MFNKKGQALGIIALFAVVVAIFITSALIINITNKVLTPFSDTLSTISEDASDRVSSTNQMVNKWWDYAIVLIFIINVIMLFISSFLIDVHPVFIIIYIFALMFLFIFGTSALSTIQDLYLNDNLAEGLQYTPITNWIVNNFMIILLGIAVLSGVIMYAKFKFGVQNV